MAAKRFHRNTEAQSFPVEQISRWKETLESCISGECNHVLELLGAVLEPSSRHVQLAAMRKIGCQLGQTESEVEEDIEPVFLGVLVEMHWLCGSRHPLQRAIASILQSLAEEQVIVEKIEAVLIESLHHQHHMTQALCHMTQVSDHMRRIQYVESLMENYRPGEKALQIQLPLVLEHCVTAISTESLQLGVQSSLLAAYIKTVMTLLHKFSDHLEQLLGSRGPSNTAAGCSEVGGADRSQWPRNQLVALDTACGNILKEGGGAAVAQELRVSAAMLSVAVRQLLKLPPSASLEQWLSSGLCSVSLLAVSHAILAKLPPSVLLSSQLGGSPLLLVLFPELCRLFDSVTESSERFFASRILALWTNVTRVCVKEDPASEHWKAVMPGGGIVQTLLHYIWTLWEDPIDGIRHQCREMFENVIKIYQLLQTANDSSQDFLSSLATGLLSLDSPTRGKFLLLTSLAPHLSMTELLHGRPRLPPELLAVMGHQSLACHAGELWSRLVELHWSVTDGKEEEDWRRTWVEPLVEAMCTDTALVRKHISQHCLPVLFHCSKRCMEHINSSLASITTVSPASKLSAQLACLRCAKQDGKKLSLSFSESFTSLFQAAMHHADEQLCLSALGLVCESRRTTEPPDPAHLTLLLRFIELNSPRQSPGFRNPAITAFKKLFVRIRDSSYALSKLFQKRKDAENPELQITVFKDFLQSLLDQQFAVVHPGSSFQRRNFALSLLQLVACLFEQRPTGQVIVESEESQIPSVFDFKKAVTKQQARSLFDALRDPFDANRSMCLQLLLTLPVERTGLHDWQCVGSSVELYLSLASSPKSSSCTSATYLLHLMMKCNAVALTSHLTSALANTPGSSIQSPHLRTAQLLCQLLLQQIATAEGDLLKASMEAPMYGLIQSIRVAIQVSCSLGGVCNEDYRTVVSGVVAACQRVARIVSPVVCSSSPEGFLPQERSKSDAGGLINRASTPATLSVQDEVSSGYDVESFQTSSGNAQSLLLCCWHSMKEISLLLGDLVEQAPPLKEDGSSSPLLSQDQLEAIAGVFMHQLTEARHRGAFEMAYGGFSKLCVCLWSSPLPELGAKPSSWVTELLDSLQSSSLTRLLSVSRRSAGLPFFLQAILTSEPAHSAHSCTKLTMQTLLTIARTKDEEAASLESQPAAVHALNILRALYRDARLGEHIVTFIPDGVMIAIDGFSASLWPVRNSSTLLFSALISRIFGAKRVQDEHSIENKMTSKEFFSRYPTLHSFLLQQLQQVSRKLQSSSTGEDRELQPRLFPVLLVLSRLFPSSLDEADSLTPFIPLLISCSGCAVWKSRVLISCTVVSMATKNNCEGILSAVFDGMNLSDQNQLHGLLLIAERLLEERANLLRTTSTAQHESLLQRLMGALLSKLHLASKTNECALTRALYLDVVRKVFEQLFQDGKLTSLPLEWLAFVGSCADDLRSSLSKTKHFLFSVELCAAQLKLCLASKFEHAKELLLLCLRPHCPPAVQLLSLQLLNSASSASAPLGAGGVSEDTATFSALLASSDPDILAEVYVVLAGRCSSAGVCCSLADTVSSAMALLAQSSIRLELRLSLLHFLSLALPLLQDPTHTMPLLCWLERVCVPTQPVELRVMAASELLPALWNLIAELAASDVAVVSSYCRTVVGLLQDPSCDVHEEMAASVSKTLTDKCEVERPNSSSALQWFISSLPMLITDVPACCSTLLSLLALEPVAPPSAESTNPLFDEDPVNDYAEELVVSGHVIQCLSHMTVTHRSVVVEHLELLREQVTKWRAQEIGSNLGSNIWENPALYVWNAKMKLLSDLFLKSNVL